MLNNMRKLVVVLLLPSIVVENISFVEFSCDFLISGILFSF